MNPTGLITEKEIRASLLEMPPVPIADFVAMFRPRLTSFKSKRAFAGCLRRVSSIRKIGGVSHIVLRETRSSVGSITEEEVTAALWQMAPVRVSKFVAKFNPKLKSWKNKQAFLDILSGGSSSFIVQGGTISIAPVTEEEMRDSILLMAPVTTRDLVIKFKPRLKTIENRGAFAGILRRISKIQRSSDGTCHIVLKDG